MASIGEPRRYIEFEPMPATQPSTEPAPAAPSEPKREEQPA